MVASFGTRFVDECNPPFSLPAFYSVILVVMEPPTCIINATSNGCEALSSQKLWCPSTRTHAVVAVC